MNNGVVEAPFKPFTLDEVTAITGVAPSVLDAWVRRVLPLCQGELDRAALGLDWMQTFGVYVGRRWLDEGAGLERATLVMAICAGMTLPGLDAELAQGRSWPAKASGGPNVLVPPPPRPAGRRINLKVLLAEFRAAVKRVFPNG